ncbi:ABC transporter substrate-binding protein [Petroclostridium sp. X23]|uniref:ABC transporter substrate-binding protein n=1 Tax=Petroclostridium sp. X23 TaxID=3045146 RepID=UPI0024ACAD65|nr:ABC transporter substrate-binding protein [Petroclostridium sp. X23]WHH56815.1 ABC transporter substrate-binding protein [Petroclostridium sp. X23]
MKQKIRLVLLPILIISFIALNFNGCAKKDLTKVRLNEVTHSVFYAPQYAAISQGFFEEEGLEVELTNGGGADKVMTALLSGQADIGFMGPEATLYVYNEGKEDHAVNFAQLTKRDGSFLLAREPDPNFSWDKVKDTHIIAGRKGGVPEMTLEYVIRKHGLVPNKDVNCDTTIQFNLMAGAFTGGTGHYVALFEPTASMLEKEGKGHIVASIGKDSGELPYTVYSAKKSYIEKNKDIIQKFTNAIYKGQLWVEKSSYEEIAKAIKPFFPDAEDQLLVTVVKRYKDQDTWAKDPVMKPEALDLLQQIMSEAGELDQKVPYQKVVTTEFAGNAIKEVK